MFILMASTMSLPTMAVPVSSASCRQDISKRGSGNDLPPSCRSLGALTLGSPERSAIQLLGPPDAKTGPAGGLQWMAWIVPRSLNRTLKARPIRADQLRYGVVYVGSRDGRIVAVRDDSSGLAKGLNFAGLKAGDPVAQADRILGRPQVSRAGDYRSYGALPVAVYSDDTGRTITGFDVADRQADLNGGTTIGMPQMNRGGRIAALRLHFAR